MSEYIYIIGGVVVILIAVAILLKSYSARKTYTYTNVYYPNGNIRRSFKQLNATDAEERVYYETGELNKTCYVSCGKRQGAFIVRYRNGKEYMKGKYCSGKYVGEVIILDQNGNIKQKLNY